MKKFDTTFKKRPLSWSQLSQFNYSRETWYQSYVLGIRGESNEVMNFGKTFGEKLATDSSFMPDVLRHSVFEYKIEAKLGKIHMIGYADSYEPHTKLCEYKTHGKNGWSQNRADLHGQLTMYCLGLYLAHGVKPESLDITLIAFATQENMDFSISLADRPPAVFKTKRSMREIMEFSNFIKKTIKEMEKYVKQKEEGL